MTFGSFTLLGLSSISPSGLLPSYATLSPLWCRLLCRCIVVKAASYSSAFAPVHPPGIRPRTFASCWAPEERKGRPVYKSDLAHHLRETLGLITLRGLHTAAGGLVHHPGEAKSHPSTLSAT